MSFYCGGPKLKKGGRLLFVAVATNVDNSLEYPTLPTLDPSIILAGPYRYNSIICSVVSVSIDTLGTCHTKSFPPFVKTSLYSETIRIFPCIKFITLRHILKKMDFY